MIWLNQSKFLQTLYFMELKQNIDLTGRFVENSNFTHYEKMRLLVLK